MPGKHFLIETEDDEPEVEGRIYNIKYICNQEIFIANYKSLFFKQLKEQR